MSITNSKLFFNIRKSIYLAVGYYDAFFNIKNNLFIFCYHAIGDDTWRYGVSKSEIEKQMRFLLKKYQSIKMEDVENHIKGAKQITKPSFVVTFDDGYADILQLIPLFRKLKIYPTVFILGDIKNANHEELENEREFLSKLQITKLKKAGWDIESHGMTHAYLPSCKNPEYEIKESKTKIAKDLGINTKYIAYPKGGYTKDVIETVKKAGYSMALSMDPGFINQKTNLFAIPRVGVDRSHSFSEFKYSFSPSAIRFKSLFKTLL